MMRAVRFENGRRIVEAVTVDRVTPAQMRIALHRAGLLDAVNQIVSTDAEAAIVWEYAVEILRQSPLIEALKGNQIRPFADDEIDALFAQAAAV